MHVVMQADACLRQHFEDGFYEIKRPSKRLSARIELNILCLRRDAGAAP